MSCSLRRYGLTITVALATAVVSVAAPAAAGRFLTKKKALKLFYTKAQSDAAYYLKGSTVTNSANLDCLGCVGSSELAFDPATQSELDALASGGVINTPSNPVDWTKLKNVPAGFADGADAVDGGTAADLSCSGCVSLGELGFDPATQSELDAHKSSADHDGRYFTESELQTGDGTINDVGDPVHWTRLQGVPAGFADGTDADTTYTASQGITITGGNDIQLADCAANQVWKRNAGDTAWVCADDNDTTYTGSGPITVIGTTIGLSSTGCVAGEVWRWDGASWQCAAAVSAGSAIDVSGAGVVSLSTTGCVTGEAWEWNGASWDCEPNEQTRAVQWFKDAGDTVPTDTLSERVAFTAPASITITDVFVEPAASLTANDTNFAALTVSRRDSNGANQVTVAAATTQTTGTGSWSAFSSETLGSISNSSLTDGQKLTFEITKSGVGVAVPAMTLQVEYTMN